MFILKPTAIITTHNSSPAQTYLSNTHPRIPVEFYIPAAPGQIRLPYQIYQPSNPYREQIGSRGMRDPAGAHLLGVAALVGVVLDGGLAVGLLEVVLGGVLGHAQDLVIARAVALLRRPAPEHRAENPKLRGEDEDETLAG